MNGLAVLAVICSGLQSLARGVSAAEFGVQDLGFKICGPSSLLVKLFVKNFNLESSVLGSRFRVGVQGLEVRG